MKPKQKNMAISRFKVLDEAQGIAEMIVSTFDVVDSYNERCKLGCFAKAIARKAPKGVWCHDWTRPIAKSLEVRELAPGDPLLPDEIKALGGLYVKGQFNLETEDGRDAFSHLKFGSIDEFSIGYYDVKTQKARDGVTDLLELDLREWSPVLVGANPSTSLLGTKAEGGSERESGPFSRKALAARLQSKGDYLGRYAEGYAITAAINDLWYSFYYGPVWDAVFGDGDNDQDDNDPVAYLSAAFDEFRDISLAIVKALRALMDDSAGDAAQDAEAMMEMMSAVMPRREKTEAAIAPPPAGGTFAQQLQAALAAVEGCIERGAALKALRAKDGRGLSTERRAQVAEITKALEELTAVTQPATTPEPSVLQAYLRERTEMERLLLA